MEPRQVLSADEIDLSSAEFWARPIAERDGAFLTLREQRPVSFHAEPKAENPLLPQGPGYWALTRHADVVHASRNPEIFCSGRGSNIGDLPAEFLEFFGSMINTDEPRHGHLRRIVSRGFTPRMIQKAERGVRRSAVRIVDSVIERGECYFVTDGAARLPLEIICDMMGIPSSQVDFVFERSNVILGFNDPEYVPDRETGNILAAILTAGKDLSDLAMDLGRQRQKNPSDDLTSALVNAEFEGERLTEQELGSFFVLLAVAGNETTRNAISHGLLALSQHPEERALWQADFDGVAPTAVEEIVRWATPVIHFRRTATQERKGRHSGIFHHLSLWLPSRDGSTSP